LASTVGLALETLVAVREYIRTHVDDQITTPGALALQRSDRKPPHSRVSPGVRVAAHAYHVQLRLAQACELLANGLSVSSVAFECGFADQSHLSRKFKTDVRAHAAAWANAVRA
jgi:AraC-like DNA-binding protein